MRRSRPTPPLLRLLAGLAGAAVAVGGFLALRDGEAMFGVPGRNLIPVATWARVDTAPEIAVSALVFGCISAVFLLAAFAPRWLARTPIVPILGALAFVLLVGLAFFSAGG